MTVTLAFDVYGTLIDTHGVVTRLEEIVGDEARRFSGTWRDKQLEYSFRRGLMGRYENFAVCTREALDFASEALGVALSEGQRAGLLETYRTLPAFEDVRQALPELESAGYRMYAFSNGAADAVEGLLGHAGIRHFFEGVVSCDEIRTFKPDPAVYAHFLKRAGATGEGTWLVSGNPFDVIGAVSAGMRGAWVKRTHDAVFDPWGVEPTITIEGLQELGAAVAAVHGVAGG